MTFVATICKTFSFEASHQLPHHDGVCARLHGHSYKVEVYARGEVREFVDGDPHPKEGMVVDFGDLKKTWLKYCEPLLDHRFLNETLDSLEVTTAENLARWILTAMHFVHAEVFKVRVWETATGWAETEINE